MAEDREGKTEAATPRRRQEAYESGQSAKSADLTAAVLMLTGLLMLHFMGQQLVQRLGAMMSTLLRFGPPQPGRTVLEEAMRVGGPVVVNILLPIMAVMFVVSALVNGIQVGFRVTTKPLMPNLMKLNPLGGFSRLFAGANLFQLTMNLVKLVVVAAYSVSEIRKDLPMVLSLSGYEFPQNMAIAFGLVYGLGLRIAIVLLLLGILDWLYHKWKFERDIRMTKQEIKDEARRMDGDPEIKGRRRQLARKLLMQRMQTDVPKADVVVTNPTELAIALKYDPETMAAPRVVAKGAGFLAAQIRQIAVANGVPIVERKPLAQALYKTVEVGREVPPDFYQAIAEILAYVFELNGMGYRPKQKKRELVGAMV